MKDTFTNITVTETPKAPCATACPAGIDVPRYIRFISLGKFNEALAVINEKIPFPSVCGHVCTHPCEQKCNLGIVDMPVAIRALKRFAVEQAKGNIRKTPPPKSTGKPIAIIGSGPAGLTAAYYLAKLGHSITVFESLPQLGGMMLAGIPEYRLSREVLNSEIEGIKKVGMEIRLNTRIESLDSLFQQGYDAIFLGIGAHKEVRLGVEGEDLPSVIKSAEFLYQGNLGQRIDVGEKVGVVGGGNAAIDAARMSLRFGAKKVNIFYRRTQTEMPASNEEVDAALEEGVEIVYLTSPSKITRGDGKLKLECIRMELGELDASGRARPIPIEGSEFVTELNTLVVAIGQQPKVPMGLQVKVGQGNTIEVDADMKTSRQGVFAGGDCVNGPASVIESIAAGRRAAMSMDKYLGGKGEISETLAPSEEVEVTIPTSLYGERITPPLLTLQQRLTSFDEVELSLDEEAAVNEAKRCMWCDLPIKVDSEKCFECRTCQMICSFAFTGLFNPVNARIKITTNSRNEIEFTDECVHCNLCVRYCPYGALSLVEERK